MRISFRTLGAVFAVAAMLSTTTAFAAGVVTVYSADGLRDGKPNWFNTEFKAFTAKTGIQVQYIEAGSGVIVNRVEREKTNTQADVLVTLPPFIQKAAADGLLQSYTPAGAEHIPAESKDAKGRWYALVNNYICFIYDGAVLSEAPKAWNNLLEPKFKNKVQYSTPGQAGDGTAMMLAVFHAFGSKDAGFNYLKKLQVNNVGPSSSTGKLAAKVNKGELWVANGDVQMNFAQMVDDPNLRIFWPENPDGQRTTFAIPYAFGLVHNAPHAANGKKLMDFLLSREAQEQVSSIARGYPARSDVHPTDANYKQLKKFMSGVKVWSPDWASVLKDLSADVKRWHEVTGS